MISFILGLPTWPIMRVIGILSYMLLTAGICLGIAYSFPYRDRRMKGKLYKIHTFATVSGAALGLLHGAITVIDTYLPFSWMELLVPFSAQYSPALSGLGTISVYGSLIVILTSDLRSRMKRKVWLALHMLSYPVFILALIHGFFLGTDSTLPAIRAMYAGSLILVVGLTAVRACLPRPVSGNRQNRSGTYATPTGRTEPVRTNGRPPLHHRGRETRLRQK